MICLEFLKGEEKLLRESFDRGGSYGYTPPGVSSFGGGFADDEPRGRDAAFIHRSREPPDAVALQRTKSSTLRSLRPEIGAYAGRATTRRARAGDCARH